MEQQVGNWLTADDDCAVTAAGAPTLARFEQPIFAPH